MASKNQRVSDVENKEEISSGEDNSNKDNAEDSNSDLSINKGGVHNIEIENKRMIIVFKNVIVISKITKTIGLVGMQHFPII